MSRTVQHGSEHTVQFYESDPALIATLSALITGSLEDGKRVIVFATLSRRREIERSLVARSIDISAARRRNQYVDLDAAQVLSRILVDAEPDAARFESVVGGLIADRAGEYRGVWAFGEMVAMLWNQRLYEAALRLEALWNGIAYKYGCSLYCAYPAAQFAGGGNGRHLAPASLERTHFIPPESELTSSMHRLRAIAQFREHARSRREQTDESDSTGMLRDYF